MLHRDLEIQLRKAVLEILPETDASTILVRPCPDPKFGDYQSTAVMSLAKSLKRNPRQLATEVVEKLDVGQWCEPPQIAGPGFINFRLTQEALNRALNHAIASGSGLYQTTESPRTVVIDFSSPNVAKPMHVGHIRSTLLGDCLARILRLLGHQVVTDNHIGDWGTQFGKLLVGWKTQLDREALKADPIREMERLYKSVHNASESDASVLEQARQELVKLQQGDAENLGIWKEMQELSKHQFDEVYGRLGVRFDHTLGESFYNDRLPSVVQELREQGIARESEGAQVVFFEGDPDLKDRPAMVQKSDGAANYMTTDLATIAHRLETWKPDEIVYVTDGRQQLHFKQLFAIAGRWKRDQPVKLSHVWFGSILGSDGKPFKTRSGDTVRLSDLLDEAEERALGVVSEKNPDLPGNLKKEIARVVGIGAIKYQDLLPNRQSDYVFSWDKMLSFQGNTAPYLQYAYTRVQSIFRKAGEAGIRMGSTTQVAATELDELALAKHLLNFGLMLEFVMEDYRPNYLCNYLYDLAGLYARFYENCPVLTAEDPVRGSRLRLCELTAQVLQQGLGLLGVEVLDVM